MSEDQKERYNFLNRIAESRRSHIYIFYSAVFMTTAITSWGLVGYTSISAIIGVWALIILSSIYLLYAVSNTARSPVVEKLPYLSLFITIWLLILVSKSVYPTVYHDEMTIDTYSAYLFLHHIDPYVPSNMVNVFSIYHFPLNKVTPTTYGGVVYYLIYPALSVYAFIPVAVLGIPNYWIPVMFNIATFFMLFYYYRKNGLSESIPLLAVMAFIEIILFAGAITGETDIIWAFFLGLSYVFRKKPWAAGLFFGLSLAQKQIPIVIAPFMLYLIFRENDRKYSSPITAIAVAASVFLILNAPFILMNPGAWVNGMLQSVEQPAIGVGFGFGLLSFAGFTPLTSAIFSDLLITSLAFFFVFYIRYYRSVKFAFFAFPVIIFLFNFRSLENYLIYWPMLTMLVLPDYLRESGSVDHDTTRHSRVSEAGRKFLNANRGILRKSNFSIFLIVVVIVGGGISAGYTEQTHHAYSKELQISSVFNLQDTALLNSKITSMSVNITYSPVGISPGKIPVYFRVMPEGSIQSNINALLWSSPNPYITPGNNTLTIYPDLYSDILTSGINFTLEAYYGNATSFYHTATPETGNYPIHNPYLLYPTNSNSTPFPGWNSTRTGGLSSLSYQPGGMELQIQGHGDPHAWNSIMVSTGIDLSLLAMENYTLSYSVPSSSGTYVNNSSDISGFSGILLSFNSGQENLWYGYNSTSTHTEYFVHSRVNQTIISDNTTINFRSIQAFLKSQGWGFGQGTLSYVQGSIGNSSGKMIVNNISFTRNSTVVDPYSSQASYFATPGANVYSEPQFYVSVSVSRPQEVVYW